MLCLFIQEKENSDFLVYSIDTVNGMKKGFLYQMGTNSFILVQRFQTDFGKM